MIKHVLVILWALTVAQKFNMEDIKLKTIEGDQVPKIDLSALTKSFLKAFFRPKHLKKKDILLLTSEIEELLAEHELEYQNMNTREERYLHFLINDP